jgi:hypothetical protein
MLEDKPARTDPSGSTAGTSLTDSGYIDANAQFVIEPSDDEVRWIQDYVRCRGAD